MFCSKFASLPPAALKENPGTTSYCTKKVTVKEYLDWNVSTSGKSLRLPASTYSPLECLLLKPPYISLFVSAFELPLL